MGKKSRRKNDTSSSSFGGDKTNIAAGYRARSRQMMKQGSDECYIKMDQICSLSLEEQKQEIRKVLTDIGTDCDMNDQDQFGDGDQSQIMSVEKRDIARELYSIGGDIHGHGENQSFSSFACNCLIGNAKALNAMILKVVKDAQQPWSRSKELKRLLEKRETSMRLSPLLMIVSAGKNMSVGGATGGDILQHVEVAHLLLKYGASPDAKDVLGKTVCHYGAGAFATRMTLEVADMCISAAKTSYLYGKVIELFDLKKAKDLNGLKGVVGGFDSKTKRRSVILVETSREVWVKPANVRLLSPESPPEVTMLADVQDRLGSVSLHEVVMNDRLDVAKFLLQTHETSIRTFDLDNISPLKMSTGGGMMASDVCKLIAEVAQKEGSKSRKAKKKQSEQICANCKKDLGKEGGKKCSACVTVAYCGKECQKEHWNNGHKQECKKIASLYAGVKVCPPPTDMSYATLSLVSGSSFSKGSYRRPPSIGINEKFVVKIQANGDRCPILVYDESRRCEFDIKPQSPGFQEILTETQKEMTWDGRKTFMKASFDEADMCTIYPATAGVKAKYSW